MTKLFTCPICGGHLKIQLDTGIAVCDSCGETPEIDPAQIKKIRETGSSAERFMRQNTAAGYAEAIRLLHSIEFAADVKEKIAFCEAQLDALQEKRERQQEAGRDTDKKDTALGIFLIVVIVLIVLALIAGVITLIVLWSRGQLSPTAVTVIVCAIAGIAALALIGKAKRGN